MPPPSVNDDFRVAAHDRVGLEGADLADEQLAEREIVHEAPVRLMQEAHPRIAHDRGRPSLLLLARPGELDGIEIGVLAARVAGGATNEPSFRAGVDPGGRCPGRAEVRVIGVSDDDHEAARSPLVGGCRVVTHESVCILKKGVVLRHQSRSPPDERVQKRSPQLA